VGSGSREVPAAQRRVGHRTEQEEDGHSGVSTAVLRGPENRVNEYLARIPALAWLAAGVAVFAVSVLVYQQLVSTNPILWGHTDEWVYRAAGEVVRQHPADVYRVLLGEPGATQLPFTYPPFAALLFTLGTGFSFAVWQMVLVVVNIALLPVIFFLSLRVSGRGGITGAALAFALAAMALWLEPVYMTLYFGQINLILLALVIVDLALPDSCKWKGIGVGIAAGIKLTPLIFVPFLLGSRRVRAGLVALLTFAVTVAIGFGVLPAAARNYWTSNLDRPDYKLQNQSIDGFLERLLPGHSAVHTLWLAVAFAVALAGLALAVIASRRGLELLGIVLAALTGLLISPISWTHHWVWAVVPGLALMAAGARRRATAPEERVAVRPRDWIARVAGIAVILILFGEWPKRTPVGHVSEWLPSGLLRFAPHGNGLEYGWHGSSLLLGNMYLIVGAVAMAGAAGYLWVTRNYSRDTAHAGHGSEPLTKV
jgi:alpha-1,2-mannosyltransferase